MYNIAYKPIFVITPVLAVLLGAIPTALADIPNGTSPAIIQSNQTCNQDCIMGYNAGGNPNVSLNNNCPATSVKAPSVVKDYCLGYANAQLVHAINVINTTQTETHAQGFVGTDFGDFSDLSNIPLVGGMIASHSITTGVLNNEQGVFIPWSVICQKGNQYLLKSCASLLNPDGTLTAQGDTAVGCIRNGFAAAILGTKLGLSFDQIKSALGFAAGATGCGGIVDLNQIQNSPDFQSLLAAVPIR